jgi:hypothetical protein
MSFAEGGFPLVHISQMILMEGVAQGQWTVDMALLMAGPVTKIIEIMCDSQEIDYDIGIQDKDTWQTGHFMKALTVMNRQNNTYQGVGEAVAQQMPQIDAAAEQQQGSSSDSGSDSGGQQDIGMQGFAAMQGGDPKNPTGQDNKGQQ